MGVCIIEGNGGEGILPSLPSPKGYIVHLGSGNSFDLSDYDGYHNFTEANFRISSIGFTVQAGSYNDVHFQGSVASSSNTALVTMKYNQSTGVLTIAGENGNDLKTYGGTSSFNCYSTTTISANVDLITERPIRKSLTERTYTSTRHWSTQAGHDVTAGNGAAWARGVWYAKAVAKLNTDGTVNVKAYAKGSLTVNSNKGDGVDSGDVTKTYGDVEEFDY